jgi:excisionase family DNA binding protein
METISTQRQGLLLSADELAEQLRVSRSKAYQLMRCGEIPTVKMGRSVRVRQRDIDEYIQRNTYNSFDLKG